MSLEKVLPNSGARRVYKQALEWTDSGVRDDGKEEAPRKECDPFISLSKRGRDGPIDDTGLDATSGRRDPRKFHKLVSDQLKNLISAPYAAGHIGIDMGLQYTTEKYVWGVTYERRGVPNVSRKSRVLLIRKDVLEMVEELDVSRIIGDGDDDYSQYRRDRWQDLKTLRKLYSNDQYKNRCFLVGDVVISVPKPGGETRGTTIPWEKLLKSAVQIDQGPCPEATSTSSAPEPLLRRVSAATGRMYRSISHGDKAMTLRRFLDRKRRDLFNKLVGSAEHVWRTTAVSMILLSIAHHAQMVDAWGLYDLVYVALNSKFGSYLLGTLFRDAMTLFYGITQRGKEESDFSAMGFSGRLNVSLNSFVYDGNNTHHPRLELRTMAEMSIEEVLPSLGARQMLMQALSWTDQQKRRQRPAGFDPFVSLSDHHAGLGIDDVETWPVEDDLKKMWKMSCAQLVNVVSAPFADGHIGEDMRENYSSREYVWAVTYQRPKADDKITNNQKLRVLLIQKSTLKKLHELKTDEEVNAFKNQLIPQTSNNEYNEYRKGRFQHLTSLARLVFSTREVQQEDGGSKYVPIYRDRCFLVGTVKLTVPSPGAGREGVAFLDRYRILPHRILHRTPTSIVVCGTDILRNHAPVALKFINSVEDYKREIGEVTGPTLQEARKKENQTLVQVIESDRGGGGRISKKDMRDIDADSALAKLNLVGKYLVVLEAGENNLAEAVGRKPHLDHKEIVEIARDVADALNFLNGKHEISHGDVKLRNFVNVKTSFGKEKWKAIDLDGSCRHGETIGAKISTACCPPEMARLRYNFMYPCSGQLDLEAGGISLDRSFSSPIRDFENRAAMSPRDRSTHGSLEPAKELPSGQVEDLLGSVTDAADLSRFAGGLAADDVDEDLESYPHLMPAQFTEDTPAAQQRRWMEWLNQRAESDELCANVSYDIWSFGVLLYTLCVPGAVSMFLSSASDQILDRRDLHTLAFEWDLHKLQIVGKIANEAARDLVLWCLQSNPRRRPPNFGEILRHPFFHEATLMRFPSSPKSRARSASSRDISPRRAMVQAEPIVSQTIQRTTTMAARLSDSRLPPGKHQPEPHGRATVAFAAGRQSSTPQKTSSTLPRIAPSTGETIARTSTMKDRLAKLPPKTEAGPAAMASMLQRTISGSSDPGKLRRVRSGSSVEDSSEADMAKRVRSLHLTDTVVKRARDLHSCIEDGDTEGLNELFEAGGVHVNLTIAEAARLERDQATSLEGEMKPQLDLCAMQDEYSSVLPIHRAARQGHLEIVKLLADEVRTKPEVVLNAQMPKYQYTALHLAVLFDNVEVVDYLIKQGCDTSIRSYRGKTAWDIADEQGAKHLLDLFDKWASVDQEVGPSNRAGLDGDGRHTALSKEHDSRLKKPKGACPTFHEDLELDHARLGFWELKKYEQWKLEGDGHLGRVYAVPVFPTVQQGARHFDRLAVRVSADPAVHQLIPQLARVTHENVVSILGYTEGTSPCSPRDSSWMMALEFADTDLERMLHGEDSSADDYAPKLMLRFAQHIADGMAEIHSNGLIHLDLCPSNIRLAKQNTNRGTTWVAKVANFGLPLDASQRLIGCHSHPAYTAPECSILSQYTHTLHGEEAMYEAGPASDVFSFAVVLWEMFARKRVASAFAAAELQSVWTGADGQADRSMPRDADGSWCREIPMYSDGCRPKFPSDFPPTLLRGMIEACWETKPENRPDFKEVSRIFTPKLGSKDRQDEKWLKTVISTPWPGQRRLSDPAAERSSQPYEELGGGLALELMDGSLAEDAEEELESVHSGPSKLIALQAALADDEQASKTMHWDALKRAYTATKEDRTAVDKLKKENAAMHTKLQAHLKKIEVLESPRSRERLASRTLSTRSPSTTEPTTESQPHVARKESEAELRMQPGAELLKERAAREAAQAEVRQLREKLQQMETLQQEAQDMAEGVPPAVPCKPEPQPGQGED